MVMVVKEELLTKRKVQSLELPSISDDVILVILRLSLGFV